MGRGSFGWGGVPGRWPKACARDRPATGGTQTRDFPHSIKKRRNKERERKTRKRVGGAELRRTRHRSCFLL